MPAISSMSPSTGDRFGIGSTAGTPAPPLVTLTGTGYVPASVISVDGSPVATTYVSATQVQFTPSAAVMRETGAKTITVANPSPGGGTSAPSSFTVANNTGFLYAAFRPDKASSGISAWNNELGTAHTNALQATPANQTTLTAANSGGNNQPSFSFSGGIKYFETDATAFSVPQPFGVIVIGKVASGLASGTLQFLVDGANGNRAATYATTTGSPSYVDTTFFNAGTPGVVHPAGDISNATGIVIAEANGSNSKVFVNNGRNGATGPAGTTALTHLIFGVLYNRSLYPLSGDEYEVLIPKRAMSRAERSELCAYASSRYGITLAPEVENLVVCIGDSQTNGYTNPGTTTTPRTLANCYPPQLQVLLGSQWRAINGGISGITVASIASDLSRRFSQMYDATLTKQIFVVQGGLNDISQGTTGAATYNNLKSICNALKALGSGVKVVVLTSGAIASWSGFTWTTAMETERVSMNSSTRTNWATFADALVDVGMDATLGNAANCTNRTYFQTDNGHWTPAGDAIVANLVATAISTL